MSKDGFISNQDKLQIRFTAWLMMLARRTIKNIY